jgi:nicotinamidase-related amidase
MKPEALLIVDVQYGFMGKGADRVIQPIAELVQKYSADSLYYLKYLNHPDSLFTKHLDWDGCMTSNQTDIVSDVYIQGSQIFNHFGYLPPSELLTALAKYKTVGVCGVDTDACVMAAVFALWDAEIHPVVLSRYCASSGGENFHQAALDLMLRQFGAGCIRLHA